MLLSPLLGNNIPFITFFPAVLFSAWYGGFRAGALSVLISAATADYYFIAPVLSFSISNPIDQVEFFVFVVVGFGAALLGHSQRRALERADSAEIAERTERQRFETTLASIGDGVIAANAAGRINFMNEVAESLTGWKHDEALGEALESVFRIINEDTRRPVDNPALRAMKKGRIVGLANHAVLINRNGGETPIDDSGAPIHSVDGETLGGVLIFRDVTEHRRAERLQAELLERERLARSSERVARKAAEAAEMRLKLALESGRMGIWDYDVRSGKVVWSPALEQIHGFQPGAFPGTFEAFRDEIHPEDREHVLCTIKEAIERRQDHQVEYRIIRKDRSVRWVEGRGRLFLDGSGAPERMLGVCADITERRQAADAESKARRAAEEANRAKDEFLAMLSHELRNPLSSILGWARILRTGQMPFDSADHALEVIERNARAEVQLVESLLDLSRIAAGKLELNWERVDLPPILQTVVDSLQPEAGSKDVKLEFAAPPEVVLLGDSGRLQQIFWNLLTNALKFTPRGGCVQVRLLRLGSQAQIQVIDDGEGIDPDFLPQIFHRFRQAESGTGRIHGGLGLGLAIVRELVHAHGGTVVAESPGRGQGSTLTVTLPMPAVIPAHLETANVDAENPELTISGVRVLVVDDDADARELIALTLESDGAAVQSAATAADAIIGVREYKPDIMIADIGMPHEDGYALIQRVRAAEREQSHKHLPAIALTAYATPADRDRALSAGYDIHLAKPVGPGRLMQAVASFRKAKQTSA